MKITNLNLYLVRPRWCFLEMETDEGITGWGEPVLEGHCDAVKACVEEMKPYLIGHDPSRIEDIWSTIYRAGFYRGGGVLMSAIAGIDQALWDIKGKVFQAPVYQLMGGPCRDSIRVYSLHRSYRLPRTEGILFPALMAALLVLLVGAPALLRFTESGGGPGAQHAAVALSLAAGLVVGALAQHTRLCMVGGIRDMILFRESKLLLGFVAVFASALVCNLILTAVTAGTYFNPGFTGQAVAHTDGVWNFLGMLLAGYGCVLLGGCPLRQLVLSGEGNTDSAITVLGLMAGAAMAHNFGLASSGEGPTANGKIAVVIGLAVVTAIACLGTFGTKRK